MLRNLAERVGHVTEGLLRPCLIQGMRVPAWLAWATRLAAVSVLVIPLHQVLRVVFGPDHGDLPLLGVSEATLASWSIAAIMVPAFGWVTFLGWLQQRSHWSSFVKRADAEGVQIYRVDRACPADEVRTAVVVRRSTPGGRGTAQPQELELWDPAREVRAHGYVALSASNRIVATAMPAERDAERKLIRWGFRVLDAAGWRERVAIA